MLESENHHGEWLADWLADDFREPVAVVETLDSHTMNRIQKAVWPSPQAVPSLAFHSFAIQKIWTDQLVETLLP